MSGQVSDIDIIMTNLERFKHLIIETRDLRRASRFCDQCDMNVARCMALAFKWLNESMSEPLDIRHHLNILAISDPNWDKYGNEIDKYLILM